MFAKVRTIGLVVGCLICLTILLLTAGGSIIATVALSLDYRDAAERVERAKGKMSEKVCGSIYDLTKEMRIGECSEESILKALNEGNAYAMAWEYFDLEATEIYRQASWMAFIAAASTLVFFMFGILSWLQLAPLFPPTKEPEWVS
ncbi:MAG TPA: hypothetical protein VD967_01335 [Candidatus Paceibacterota bacterium]|nr:hypothetical protein [Candidatus Paceibacterota bacterium]